MSTLAPVRPDLRPVDTSTVPPMQPPRPGRLRRLARGPETDPAWARPALLVLLAGTALLYLWDLSASGYANSFYAAAVQEGTKSWKAWLFGSLDSGNSITVDKPPAALWVMGLSARIFGFNSWSLLVPQALEGVASVALLYGAVRRVVGARAGLVAGAALALTPAAVLMFRFDNPDALLTLLLTAGAYAMTRALERPSARWVSLAGTALGFAFLTKMLQGLLVLPVFALVYLVLAPTSFRRRLALGAVALIVSAGWYLALVTLWPAGSRPYIGGSTDNNILELAFGYNGFGRLLGGEGNGGGGGGAAGSSFGGATGLTRLFSSEMGNEISWLLPAALVALVGGLLVTRRAPRTDRTRAALLLWGGWLLITALVFSYMKGTIHPYYTVALAPAIAASVAIGVAALWRRRDSIVARIAMALTVAASGAWGFVLLDRVATWLPALRWTVVVLTVVAAAALLVPPARIGAAARRVGQVGIVAGLVASLLGTGSFAVATAAQPHTGSIPSVGPSVAQTSGMGGGTGGGGGMAGGMGGGMGGGTSGRAGGGSAGSAPSGSKAGAPTGTRPTGQRPSGSGAAATRGGGSMTGTASAALIKALKATSGTWAAAVSGDQTAAELELATGKAVIAIGGWSGSDNSPTLAQFEAWVKAGRIGYYISSGSGGMSAGGSDGSGVAAQIATWVAKHYTATTIGGSTVYKLS